MTFLLDALPAFIGIVMGAWVEYMKQKAADQQRQTEMYIAALGARDKSLDAARKYQSPDSSWSRKFIVQSVIGSLFLFPMVLTLLNWMGRLWHSSKLQGGICWAEYEPIAIYIPQEIITSGFITWIYSNDTTQYIPIYGFVLLPIHISMALLIGGFYFGQGGMRRSMK